MRDGLETKLCHCVRHEHNRSIESIFSRVSFLGLVAPLWSAVLSLVRGDVDGCRLVQSYVSNGRLKEKVVVVSAAGERMCRHLRKTPSKICSSKVIEAAMTGDNKAFDFWMYVWVAASLIRTSSDDTLLEPFLAHIRSSKQ